VKNLSRENTGATVVKLFSNVPFPVVAHRSNRGQPNVPVADCFLKIISTVEKCTAVAQSVKRSRDFRNSNVASAAIGSTAQLVEKKSPQILF
jgi:hypothetical protein